MASKIDLKGLLLLIQKLIIDALVDYKFGKDGWLIEHFDETIYALLTPITSRRLMEIANKMPEVNNKKIIKRWMFDNNIFTLVEREKKISPTRLKQVFGISTSQACMVLKRLCCEGKLKRVATGEYTK